MANTNTETFFYGTDYDRPTLAAATNKKASTYGLWFPLGTEPENKRYFQKVSGYTNLKQRLSQFIRTEKGERVMKPDFGLSLRKYVFSNIDEFLFSQIREEVVTGLQRYFPDVKVLKLQIFQDSESAPSGGNSIRIILIAQEIGEETATQVEVGIV